MTPPFPLSCDTPVPMYEVGEPLPEAVAGDPSRLSPEALAEVKSLLGADPKGFFLQLIKTWLTIIGSIALAVWVNHWALSVLVIFYIGTRQNILGLLIHEQTHRLGLQSKAGDHLTNLSCAFPLLITLEGYRRVHLAHHHHYFTHEDPDYRRKQGREWSFPQRARRFIWTIITDLVGMNIVRTFKGKAAHDDSDRPLRGTPLWVRLTFYAVAATSLTLTGAWPIFLIYWFLPLLTVMQVIVRFGAICEHKYNLVNASMSGSTPMIEPTWWEKLLLPNLNFNLHIYHHWFPAIASTRLPRVHGIFRREGLVADANVFHGYIAYVRYLVSLKKETGIAAGSDNEPAAAVTAPARESNAQDEKRPAA
ncbi:MAG: fatty acid desaturase [Phycisphaeraceae bacterium]